MFVALFAIAGAGCGYFGARYALAWLTPIPGPKWLRLLPALGLPLIWLAVAGFHELGHVVGGWIGVGKFLLWMVGPFMLRRTPAGIRTGWNRSVNLAGGMAVCVPLELTQVTPRRMAVMIAGGPVSSLLLTLATVVWPFGWRVLRLPTRSGARSRRTPPGSPP